MKTEIYKRLKPYEEYLAQAQKDYMRVPARKYAEIAEIYEAHFGKGLTASERSCGKCQLRALKRLAADYYKFKESPYCKGMENGKGESTEDI